MKSTQLKKALKMNIPPISSSNSSEFINPFTSIELVISTLEESLNQLIDKINAVVVSTKKELDTQDLLQVAGCIRSLEKCSVDADKAIGNPQTIMKVKQYIQELSHVLSTPGASILNSVEDDYKQNPSATEQLKTTLETFAKLPHVPGRLIEELKLIAQDIHDLGKPRRHIG